VRGIERSKIVKDDYDRDNFMSRLGALAKETGTAIYAWALLSNHAHILLRSGAAGLPTLMRRLLSGYATWFNRRHRRYGHLFHGAEKYQFVKSGPGGTQAGSIKIDILTGPRDRFEGTRVRADYRRARPKPSVGIHAHPVDEVPTTRGTCLTSAAFTATRRPVILWSTTTSSWS